MSSRVMALREFLRAHGRLLMIGLCAEILFALYCVRQFPLLQSYDAPYRDMGQFTDHSHSAFVSFLLVMTWLFILFVLALRETRALSGRASLWFVLATGGIFALTLTFVYPVTALDIFGYIDQSLVAVQYHQNPIFVAPASHPEDPLMRLSAGWAQFGSPYGPLGIAVNALPSLVVRRNLLANLILLKLIFSGALLLAAYFVHEVLQRFRPKAALSGALFVAWNPFVLWETAANGHNDIVMMALVVTGLLFLLEGSFTVGALCVLASALVKYATIVLLPPVLVYGASRQADHCARVNFLIRTTGLLVVLAIVAYAPFWEGPDTFRRSFMEGNFYLYSFSSLATDLFPGLISPTQATLAGRLLLVPIYLYALWLSARQFSDLVNACFLTCFSFLALGVNDVKYWYVVWPTVIAACAAGGTQRVCAVLMAFGMEIAVALNIFVWVWVGVTAINFRPIDATSYALVFVIPAAAVAVSYASRRLPDLVRSKPPVYRRDRAEPL